MCTKNTHTLKLEESDLHWGQPPDLPMANITSQNKDVYKIHSHTKTGVLNISQSWESCTIQKVWLVSFLSLNSEVPKKLDEKGVSATVSLTLVHTVTHTCTVSKPTYYPAP